MAQLNFTNFLTTLSNLESAKVGREAQREATRTTRLSNDRSEKDDYLRSVGAKGYITLDERGVTVNPEKAGAFLQDVPLYMKALNYDENQLGAYTGNDGQKRRGRLLSPTQYADAKVPSSVKKKLAEQYGGVENIPADVLQQNAVSNTLSLNLQRADGKIAPVTVNRSSDPDDELLVLSQEEFLDTLEGSLQGVFGSARPDSLTALASGGLIQRQGEQAASDYATQVKDTLGKIMTDENLAGSGDQVAGIGEALEAKKNTKTEEEKVRQQNANLNLEKVTVQPSTASDQPQVVSQEEVKPTSGVLQNLEAERTDLQRQLDAAETNIVKRRIQSKINKITSEIEQFPKKQAALQKRKEKLQRDLDTKQLGTRQRGVKENAIKMIDKQLTEMGGPVVSTEQNRLQDTGLSVEGNDISADEVQTNAKNPENLSKVQKFLQDNEVNSLQEFVDKTKQGVISQAEARAAAAVIAIATSPDSRLNQNQLFEQLTNAITTGMPGSSQLDVQKYNLQLSKFNQQLREYADTQEGEFKDSLVSLYTTAGKEDGFTSQEFIQQMKATIPQFLEEKRFNQLSTTDKELIDGIIAQAVMKRAQEEGPEDWSDLAGDIFLRAAADDTLGNSFENLRIKYDSKNQPQSIVFVEKRGSRAVPLEESISWSDFTAFIGDSRIENYILSRALRIN